MGTINTFELSHFKAFDAPVEFKLQGKNALIFGENGSGKTSVYEGLKMAFFHDRLEATAIPASATPEDANAIRTRLYESYRNARSNTVFSLKIDGSSYEMLNQDSYKVYLLTHDDFELKDGSIILQKLLERAFFIFAPETAASFMGMFCDDLEAAVNNSLQHEFSETVRIRIEKGDGYRCVLTDLDGKLSYGTNLNLYFNEGKIHLILIAIFINVFLLLADKRKTNILVLDDFITSLDATNRAFVLRFLFSHIRKQESLQVLLLTHNVSFFNLIKHYINKYLPDAEKSNWVYFNLYNMGNEHKLYLQNEDTIDQVEKDYNNGAVTLENLGNRIRKLFEIQVHELAKIVISGGVEESKDILSRMMKGKPTYFNNGKDVFDLVKSLETLAKVSAFDKATLSEKILETINDYKNDPELNLLREMLKQITLFQKVSLHPTSHGMLGLAPVSQKELKESLTLIKKIERQISNLKDSNVVNV